MNPFRNGAVGRLRTCPFSQTAGLIKDRGFAILIDLAVFRRTRHLATVVDDAGFTVSPTKRGQRSYSSASPKDWQTNQ
jgi:hypothetical protein